MLDGLKRLEYRGYDSSGVAIWSVDGIKQTKRTGRVVELETALGDDLGGTLGISHTRWGPRTATSPKPMRTHTAVVMARLRWCITA